MLAAGATSGSGAASEVAELEARTVYEHGPFPGLSSLRYLDIAANGLGEEGATALCAGASKLAHLDELDVRQNNISNEQVRAIRAALPMSRAYGQWDVEFEVDGGVDALFDALRE